MLREGMIWAIPGFLGLPADWEFFNWKNLTGVDWQTFSWNQLNDWARQFNEWVRLQNVKQPHLLMGYSFGGRLALHSLIDCPQQWTAGIIISAHVGLSDSQAKIERAAKDQRWADRFQSEEWGGLMHAWNSQEVFASDPFVFKRKEQDYQRLQLIKALTQGSLGVQENLFHAISTLPMPLLWITGSQDKRFSQLGKTLSFIHPLSKVVVIPLAGHRVPWSQPEIFSNEIERFLGEIGLQTSHIRNFHSS